MKFWQKTAIISLLCVFITPVHAEYAMSLGQKPQYPADFKAFGYVNPNAPKGGSINLPMYGSFDTLNPFTLKGDKESGIAALTLDTLMVQGQDEPFAMYGLLANDIALAADARSVVFTLNPQARFHNGDAVLAKDVVSSFNTLTTDPAASPMYRFYWADVAQVVAVDDHTVRFDFKRQNAELHLILGSLPVFSHKSYPQGLAASANTPPIGSGPYRFLRTNGNRMSEFRRDSGYWAKNLPTRRGMYNFDTVRFKYYQDETAKVEGMKAAQYDVLQENIARLWARAYNNPDLQKKGLRRQEFTQHNTAGMQGFVLNTRRAPLNDLRVRQALTLSFDFETVNRQLFYGSYHRSNSYFTNSEMAAAGVPESDELVVLNPLRTRLPNSVFTQAAVEPPQTDSKLGIRPNLLKARHLLEEAGFRYQNGRLTDRQGKPLVLEFLSYSKIYERVTAKWQRDLAKIGIQLNVRVVDAAVYQRRMNQFDYDLTVVVYANSESPGNEQWDYHGCEAAKTPGSKNWAGLCDAAVNELLKHFIHFDNRRQLVAAARALDRVLRDRYLVIPNWYSQNHRLVYWDKFGKPQRVPKYFQASDWVLSTWWTA
ncbi:extracellular solute-binding protein [Stenoxybacter acetivorans]|uniref:extracellular solute-binding protein n=1 Tax=Stenoxybacter acetivorans TaxID=422441 RepID=UPI000A075237|nr:extracellular solute-binding protein [Stenoxybacter acetivorans]